MEQNSNQRRRMPEGPRGDLQYALFRVVKSLVFRGDPTSPMNELPLSQLKCLHVVGESEGLKMIDIAQRLEIGLPAVSQIVDKLVRRGLVVRQADPQDRRVVRIGLTQEARDLMTEVRQHRQMRMDATLDLLDQSSLKAVTEGLERLAEAAEQFEALERVGSSQIGSLLEPIGQSPGVGADLLVELIAERKHSRRRGRQFKMLPADVHVRP